MPNTKEIMDNREDMLQAYRDRLDDLKSSLFEDWESGEITEGQARDTYRRCRDNWAFSMLQD